MRLKDEFKIDQGYKVDPRRLKIESGWNVRHDTAELREANAELKASIKANGVLEPLTGYVQGEDLIVTNGHRRLAMTMELISEGCEILAVPFRIELPGTGEADRCLSMLTRNSGLRLTPLETAEVCKRLIGYGWEVEQIAGKTGFGTGYVKRLLTLLEAPAPVLDQVQAGDVSASLASKVVQEHGAEAPEVLQEAKEIAKANGSTKTTPKHVQAAQEARTGRVKVDWSKVGPQLLRHLDALLAATTDKEKDKTARKASEYRQSVFGA